VSDRDEAVRALTAIANLVNSAGPHEGHTLRQVGRCVYCSCGQRFQGRLPDAKPTAPSRWQVRLADGFVCYIGPQGDAERVAARHDGAIVEVVA